MKSRTTKESRLGWYYTFRLRKDGTLIIQQKNKRDVQEKHKEIYIFGKGVLDTLKEVLSD